jgi:predicted GNAT family N-acyltransferase
MTSHICAPKECNSNDFENFVALVTEGGAVSENDVRYGAAHASHLVFVRDSDGHVVAVGALKRPRVSYRNRVFRSAAAVIPASRFQIELGYVAVANKSRGRGLSHSVVSALLFHGGGTNVFATTRADKPAMHRTLSKAGFVCEGQPYRNKKGTYDIVLYIRQSRLSE